MVVDPVSARSSFDYTEAAISIRFNNHSHDLAMFRTYQNYAMRRLFQGSNFTYEAV